jgi:hypothetical protein
MRIPLLALCCLLSSCMTLDAITGGRLGNQIFQPQMSFRLSFRGFSVDRPTNITWYIRRDEQSYTQVLFRRPTGSDTHTVFVEVGLGRLEGRPASHEEFAEMAQSRGQVAAYEVEETRRHQELVTIQNQWCIRTETDAVTRGAPNAPDQELTLVVRGYRCLHPTWPATTLDFYYSERGLPDEIDEDYQAQGERILEGVRIDVSPNTPAT